ncbi:hypothetical protein [Klebsiella oxytoca]|uniref:hypothetical protein n=1 Tax=Klebsiella oxytoca TaxID=571 RepID=UPI0006683912|nr:hypothetical protein [Klebsiella oxytoca]
MKKFIIEEWVAMMPAGIVRMVVDSIDDEELFNQHLVAVKSNIRSGYRPDFIEIFSELSVESVC